MSRLLRKRKGTISSDYVDTSRRHLHSDSDDLDTTTPRSGKWSSEEEIFANRLISEFEAGILTDCEEGCTLRSYLARRLNCAPMRISKKFAGKCIGKHVFVRQLNHLPSSSRSSTVSSLSTSPLPVHSQPHTRHKKQRLSRQSYISSEEEEEDEEGTDCKEMGDGEGGETMIIEGLEAILHPPLPPNQGPWCLNQLLALSSTSSSSYTSDYHEEQQQVYFGGHLHHSSSGMSMIRVDSSASLICFDEAERRQHELIELGDVEVDPTELMVLTFCQDLLDSDHNHHADDDHGHDREGQDHDRDRSTSSYALSCQRSDVSSSGSGNTSGDEQSQQEEGGPEDDGDGEEWADMLIASAIM